LIYLRSWHVSYVLYLALAELCGFSVIGACLDSGSPKQELSLDE